MNNDMFCWMTQNLDDLKLTPRKRFTDVCLDDDVGRYIRYFGGSFTISLLDLSEEEFESLYPNATCPLSYEGRQMLKTFLTTHILNCSACIDVELINEAEDSLIEKAIRKNGKIYSSALNA